MRLRIRLIILIIASFFRKRLSLIDENVLSLRVLPNDCDFISVSSDRYVALMGLGDVNIVLRAGLLSTMYRRKWYPMTRIVTIRYRHPLRMFQKYLLRSRTIYWDDKWIWVEHIFDRNGRTQALGITKVMFVGSDGVVPVSQAIDAVGESLTPPPEPEIIANLESIEEQIRERQR